MEIALAVRNGCIVLLSANAALSDIRSWRISNRWLAFWSMAGLAYEFIFFCGQNIAGRLAGAAVPILLLGFLFICRMLGAGDIKLFCSLGVWIGAEDILVCMLFAFAAGAVISIISMESYKNRRERFAFLGKYFIETAENKNIRDYGAKKAGKARVNVAVFAFFGVMLKVAGVY